MRMFLLLLINSVHVSLLFGADFLNTYLSVITLPFEERLFSREVIYWGAACLNLGFTYVSWRILSSRWMNQRESRREVSETQ